LRRRRGAPAPAPAQAPAQAPAPDPLDSRLSEWRGRGIPSYDSDLLVTWSQTVAFLSDDRFLTAYRRGMDSGHAICRPRGSHDDIHIEWRVAVCCWAAKHASHLPGDFVECGVNTGMYSLAICEYVNFNSLEKTFWLFDTFKGIPPHQISDEELDAGRLEENAYYFDCFEITRSNFPGYERAVLVKGVVPDTLTTVAIDSVSYLSIDMNIAYPERAAIEHFWPKLTPGAVVVLDDYGWERFKMQRETLDDFAAAQDVEILALPTGQGLLLKP
jgi:O-methyltransferase